MLHSCLTNDATHFFTMSVTAGFCWWGPGANIDNGSSFLFIGAVDHIKDQRTGLIDMTFLVGARGNGPLDPP